MHSHFVKGFTVGQALTRRLVRNIVGLPGLCIDFIICCIGYIFTGDFLAYWNKTNLTYIDNTKAKPIQVITSWIADITAAIVGGITGAMIGGTFFFIDITLQILFSLKKSLSNACENFANAITDYTFDDPQPYAHPQHYLQKAWNISLGIIGSALSFTLSVIPRFIEYLFPVIGTSFSKITSKIGNIIGAAVGTTIAIALLPLRYFTQQFEQLFYATRNKIRSTIAFIYAKTNQTPFLLPDNHPYDENIHSHAFRQSVIEYKNTTMMRLLCGTPKKTSPKSEQNEEYDPTLDPISCTPFEEPVIDPCGHTFSKKSILTWLQSSQPNHDKCPISRKPLRPDQLIPNRIAADLLTKLNGQHNANAYNDPAIDMKRH